MHSGTKEFLILGGFALVTCLGIAAPLLGLDYVLHENEPTHTPLPPTSTPKVRPSAIPPKLSDTLVPTYTDAPTATPTPSPTSPVLDCVVIHSGVTPSNAYSASRVLGFPPEMEFYPGGIISSSPTKVSPSTLPSLVHEGDALCKRLQSTPTPQAMLRKHNRIFARKDNGFSPSSGSVPVYGFRGRRG